MINKEDYKNFDNFIKKYIQHCVNIPSISVVIFNSDKILHKYILGRHGWREGPLSSEIDREIHIKV